MLCDIIDRQAREIEALKRQLKRYRKWEENYNEKLEEQTEQLKAKDKEIADLRELINRT
jgi:hypothetical protein